LFLASLLRNGKTLQDFQVWSLIQSRFILNISFQVPGFNLASEWLLSLTTCQAVSAPVKAFTSELQQKGHFLLTTLDLGSFDQIQMIRGKYNTSEHTSSRLSLFSCDPENVVDSE